MAKRREIRIGAKPEPIGPVVPTVTSFEQNWKEFKLTPDQYIRSTRLREVGSPEQELKVYPRGLLEAWGFEIESDVVRLFGQVKRKRRLGRRFYFFKLFSGGQGGFLGPLLREFLLPLFLV